MNRNLQFPFSVLLVLFITFKSALSSQNLTLALDIKRENKRSNMIFTDHLLWSFESSTLLECAKECANNEECLAFSHWKNASESLLTCRGHTAESGFLSLHEDAQGARLYSVAGRTSPSPLPAADFVMYTDQAKTGWNSAKEYCESVGMTLATLDQTANDYLISLIPQSWYKDGKRDFWLGLWDSHPDNTSASAAGYRWVEGCAPLASSPWVGWAAGEPMNTVDSFCVAADSRTGEWMSLRCDSALQFLCKRTKVRFNKTALADIPGSTSPDVLCPGISCGPPPSLANATPSQANGVYRDEISYTCNTGTTHSGGNGARKCEIDGQWNVTSGSSEPICTAITCGNPPTLSSRTHSPVQAVYYYNDQVTYTCSDDKEGGSNGLRICTEAGTWQQINSNPSCDDR
ncbi:hypothetical protein BaRGS_00011424 [Batillaria attramentaria]|uniref:C-type lectin n=1 Tax=Batillaria attramentaria TaxID=370345 RepID=A0ABD0LDH6_9CAEN